jgi:hypothetical protein
MSTRKLSVDQRAQLRGELRAALNNGSKVIDVVREAAKKYSLSEITVRYYIKSLDGKKNGKAGEGSLSRLATEKYERAREARKLIASMRKAQSRALRLRRKHERLGNAVVRWEQKADGLHERIKELMS